MQKPFANVKEHWMLYDTVLIGQTSQGEAPNVPGWVETLAQLANNNTLSFFNQRTRAIGLPYCNQDVRDQMPYGFRAFSFGVSFFASAQSEVSVPVDGNWDGYQFATHDQNSAVFTGDLPHHSAVTLKVQQDEVLQSNCAICPPGYGAFGGGVGRGSVRQGSDTDMIDKIFSGVSQSMPVMRNRWRFPEPLQIPRSAALSATIELTEFARTFLGMLTKYVQTYEETRDGASTARTYYGIQVSLVGERLVQQRGQYHR